MCVCVCLRVRACVFSCSPPRVCHAYLHSPAVRGETLGETRTKLNSYRSALHDLGRGARGGRRVMTSRPRRPARETLQASRGWLGPAGRQSGFRTDAGHPPPSPGAGGRGTLLWPGPQLCKGGARAPLPRPPLDRVRMEGGGRLGRAWCKREAMFVELENRARDSHLFQDYPSLGDFPPRRENPPPMQGPGEFGLPGKRKPLSDAMPLLHTWLRFVSG